MNLYFHYCPETFSNCYLLGTDSPANEAASQKEAIIIDPGNMDSDMLRLIEDNDYSLLGVLVTHDHPAHIRGLKTIMKIYETAIYAITPVVGEHRTTLVRDGDIFNIGSFQVEVFLVPGHSPDSAVYRVDRFLFTGDAMSAGFMGNTASSFSAETQVSALRKKILSLPGDYSIFPGHGPPSSLEAERRFNLDINTFEQRKGRRSQFKFELD